MHESHAHQLQPDGGNNRPAEVYLQALHMAVDPPTPSESTLSMKMTDCETYLRPVPKSTVTRTLGTDAPEICRQRAAAHKLCHDAHHRGVLLGGCDHAVQAQHVGVVQLGQQVCLLPEVLQVAVVLPTLQRPLWFSWLQASSGKALLQLGGGWDEIERGWEGWAAL